MRHWQPGRLIRSIDLVLNQQTRNNKFKVTEIKRFTVIVFNTNLLLLYDQAVRYKMEFELKAKRFSPQIMTYYMYKNHHLT